MNNHRLIKHKMKIIIIFFLRVFASVRMCFVLDARTVYVSSWFLYIHTTCIKFCTLPGRLYKHTVYMEHKHVEVIPG